MTDDYAGYNALGAQLGVTRLACLVHVRRQFVEAQKVQPKGKTGRADIALNLIKKLYGIEREFKEVTDNQCFVGRQEKGLPVLAELKSCHPKVKKQSALGKAVGYLTSNWNKLESYIEASFYPSTTMRPSVR